MIQLCLYLCFYFQLCVCVNVCEHVCGSAGTLRHQVDSPELELQTQVGGFVTKIRSSAKRVHIWKLNHFFKPLHHTILISIIVLLTA